MRRVGFVNVGQRRAEFRLRHERRALWRRRQHAVEDFAEVRVDAFGLGQKLQRSIDLDEPALEFGKHTGQRTRRGRTLVHVAVEPIG